MHAVHRLVHSVLLGAILTLQSVEGLLKIVHQRLVVEVFIALAVQFFECLQLLDISQSHIGSQVEVEGRDGLTTVHLVLAALHRDTSQHRGRLDTLGRARGTMSGYETTGQDVIQRMLHAGERLRRVIVLVVDMQIVMLHSVAAVL